MRALLTAVLFAASLSAQTSSNPVDRPPSTKMGHSLHGDTYDVGPREKPWVMEGVGKAHFLKRLDALCWKYPDDLEALSLYALSNLWTDNRLGTNALLQRIIDKDPTHPGAHHYRIHQWIGPEADRALDSSFIYGDLAP